MPGDPDLVQRLQSIRPYRTAENRNASKTPWSSSWFEKCFKYPLIALILFGNSGTLEVCYLYLLALNDRWSIKVQAAYLRTVPLFVIAHMFCASRDIRVSFRNLPTNQQHFCAAYDYVEKADLSNGYQNPKRNLGVTTQLWEIIELRFRNKVLYILCILRRK